MLMIAARSAGRLMYRSVSARPEALAAQALEGSAIVIAIHAILDAPPESRSARGAGGYQLQSVR
jgi:hypothetical protein